MSTDTGLSQADPSDRLLAHATALWALTTAKRLHETVEAIVAIRSHLARDGDLSGGMVFDAVRFRLIELHEVMH